MSQEFRKILSLIVPKFKRDERTTRRISIISVVIPLIFGGLVTWFSYTKVKYSEKKYADIFDKMKATREEYQLMKAELDSSKENIRIYEKMLQDVSKDYKVARERMKDSIRFQEEIMKSYSTRFKSLEWNYQVILDSSRFQNELLTENKRQIEVSTKNLNRLNDSIEGLKTSLQVSSDSLAFAKKDVELMKSSIESMAGEAAKIKPQARSKTLFGHKDGQGRQLFEFSIWLDVPKQLRKNIASVTYKYNLPDEGPSPLSGAQSMMVSDPTSGFKTSYTAWGCVRNVIVQVRFKSNFSTPIFFDYCRLLDNPQIEEMSNQ